jgi:hypothetical protein
MLKKNTMKKLLFILLTFCSLSAMAAPKTVHKEKNTKKQNKQNLVKQKKFFKPVLMSSTSNCPTGYAGTVTYWLVYESTNGQVVGAGSYNNCTPVAFA